MIKNTSLAVYIGFSVYGHYAKCESDLERDKIWNKGGWINRITLSEADRFIMESSLIGFIKNIASDNN